VSVLIALFLHLYILFIKGEKHCYPIKNLIQTGSGQEKITEISLEFIDLFYLADCFSSMPIPHLCFESQFK
jgi:hypothetical protein